MRLKAIGRALLKASLSTPWAALVLSLIAWSVYAPATNRIFVEDQIHYFAELDGQTSFADGLHFWDYAAARHFWKGDDALHRPLLFVWLAAGNRLFSYHHVQWNIANLALHVLVALGLFRLLIAVRPSPLALPIAVLFLVYKPPAELVLWNHLGGYLLAFLCFLIGARAFVRLSRAEGSQSWRDIAVYACAFAVAGQFYEAMALASVMGAAIVLWCDSRRERFSPKRAAALLAPIFVFAISYAVHLSKVERITYVDRPGSAELQASDIVRSLSLEFGVIRHWAAEFAVPSSVRLSTSAGYRFNKLIALDFGDKRQQFSIVLTLALALVVAGSVSKVHFARASPLLLFLLGTTVLYIAVLGFGRAEEEILSVTYYTYLFGLLSTAGVYALVDFSRLQSRRWTAVLASLVVTGAIWLHGSETAATAREVERVNHYPARYLDQVIRFVDAHKREPDFSFAILPHPETLDRDVYLLEGYADQPAAGSRTKRLTEILFARYYDSGQPKYTLDASASKVVP